MGLFFKSETEKRNEHLRQVLSKVEAAVMEQRQDLDKMSSVQQAAICQGAVAFDKLLKMKFGTVQGIVNCSPQEINEWTLKVADFMRQSESDPHLWLGMNFGFQWFNAFNISRVLSDRESIDVVNKLWSIYEPLVKHGLKFSP